LLKISKSNACWKKKKKQKIKNVSKKGMKKRRTAGAWQRFGETTRVD
jgi:hypothetical protein